MRLAALSIACSLVACTTYGRVAGTVGVVGVVGGGLMYEDSDHKAIGSVAVGLGAFYLAMAGLQELKHELADDGSPLPGGYIGGGGGPAATLAPPATTTACVYDAEVNGYRECPGGINPNTGQCFGAFGFPCAP